MRFLINASLALQFLAAVPLFAQTDWPMYGHDPGGQQYSPLSQINTKNISSLKVAWTYDTRPKAIPANGTDPGKPAPRSRASQATPLVINGVMYLSTPYNRIVALDCETGATIWESESDYNAGNRGIAFFAGDATVPPQVVVGTTSGFLVSLDAKTGKPRTEFGDNGRVSLRVGVADKFPRGRYGVSTPPAIYKNLVFTGAQLQEDPGVGPAGDIRAWDIHTGKMVWTFHTVPRPGEKNHEAWTGDEWMDRSGANVWGFMTVDVERGLLFLPIGTPTPDFWGGDRKGSNLYGSSLVAVDAATGQLKWHFQTTHHDNWDYDLTAAPALIDITVKGKKVPAVAQWTKQGLLFFFDRLTGKPIYEVEERKVLNDNPTPGDQNWPTQPFPVKPPPISRMAFEPGEIAKVTPEHEKFCRDLLALEGGAMTGGPYAQYGPKLRVIFPGWTGGGNWSPTAFSPSLGYLYLTTYDLANLNKMVPGKDGKTYIRVGSDAAPPNTQGRFWDGVKKWPCQQPPWAELVAVNVNTGNIAWRSPLGSFEELDALGIPKTGTPEIRGGAIATAGGLVFVGATMDAKFHAFDAKTGQEIWSAKMADSAKATPITYQGKGGKQYVAIMASGGDVRGAENPGGRLYVFGLP